MSKTKKNTKTSKPAMSLEQYLLQEAGQKHLQLPHLNPDDCCCTSTPGPNNPPSRVDLIVIADTSGSMRNELKQVSQAAKNALDAIVEKCHVDLKVNWLGVGKAFSGTLFTQSAEDFLNANGCSLNYAQSGKLEEGADTVSDLSSCTNIWREDSCKVIFYISDESLDNGDPENNADTVATQQAIQLAKQNEVQVFAHFAPGSENENNPATHKNYRDLCEETGGKAFIGDAPSQALYERLLTEVICKACRGCKTIDMPKLSPCFSVLGADSECDCFESDDLEVLYIQATNCYSNVDFCNLVINKVSITNSKGEEVKPLPDGTPSVQLIPEGPICFGDLVACSNNSPSTKARQIGVRLRGAIADDYQLHFSEISFQIVNNHSTEEVFVFQVCKD